MTSPRDEHLEAVFAARGMVSEMQTRVIALKDYGDQVRAAVLRAVGSPPSAEPGDYIYRCVAQTEEELTRIYVMLEKARNELISYAERL